MSEKTLDSYLGHFVIDPNNNIGFITKVHNIDTYLIMYFKRDPEIIVSEANLLSKVHVIFYPNSYNFIINYKTDGQLLLNNILEGKKNEYAIVYSKEKIILDMNDIRSKFNISNSVEIQIIDNEKKEG